MTESDNITIVDNEQEDASLTFGMPRYEAPNPHNFSDLQLADRQKFINDSLKDYPNMSHLMVGYWWDIVATTPAEQLQKEIEDGKWAKKGVLTKKRPKPGTYDGWGNLINDLEKTDITDIGGNKIY